jgi:hypothetical protein
MALSKLLEDFAGQIAVATTDSPDEYPEWSDGYEAHMSDLKSLWSQIRPQLKRDFEQVECVELNLRDMIAAFDAGEKEKGRKAAWAIYRLDVKKLR